MVDELESLIQEIRHSVSKDYYKSPIPGELDNKVSQFINLFLNADNIDRRKILRMVDERLSSLLISFAERMASLGVREKSVERIRTGLVALLIEDHFGDWRDSLMRLSPLYHAAGKIGANPDEVFLEVAGLITNSAAISMKEFTARSPDDRSLQAFSYQESTDEDGFRYKGFELDRELFKKLGIDLD